MKNKIYPLALFLIATLAPGCREHETSLPTILVRSLPRVEQVAYGDTSYFAACRVVRLETTPASLIANVNGVSLFDGYIYVFDKNQNRLLVFDDDGRFLQDVGKKGRGVGEYLGLSGFYINAIDSTINLVDPSAKAVHVYDLSAGYLRSVKHKNEDLKFVDNFALLDNGELFCHSSTNWRANNVYSTVSAADYAARKDLLAYPVKTKDISYKLYASPFHLYNDRVIFSHPFSDTLSAYDDKGVKPYMIISDGENMSRDAIVTALERNENNYFQLRGEIRGSYNVGMNTFFENDRFIICDFIRPDTRNSFGIGSMYNAIIWDKKKNAGIFVDNYLHSSPDFGMYQYKEGNTIIRVWNNDAIFAFRDRLAKDEPPPARYEGLRETLASYDEYENPALIFYTVKN